MTSDGTNDTKQSYRNINDKNRNMEDVLLQVYKDNIKIQKQERKNNNAILFSVLEEILKKMQTCDKLFSSLKPKLEYMGSYFEGLRVGRPTEYDVNIVLTFGINYNKITLDSKECKCGYTRVILPSEFRRLSSGSAAATKGFNETKIWCDRSHRLSMQKFRSWMQKVVDTALKSLPVENGQMVLRLNQKSFQITSKTSGPAFTLTIFENSDNIIDVDLVPTLSFNLPKVPDNTKVDFDKVRATKIKQYFVVPKPNIDDYSWRLSFPRQERYYIYNKQNIKNAIKILKLLRDAQGFHTLASYYIKTIFLWESVENTDTFWKKKSLTFLVIYMLKKMKECLANKIIKNFWCPDHNLLDTFQPETCQNWCNRLARIIHDIERNKKNNPCVILQYLKIKASRPQ